MLLLLLTVLVMMMMMVVVMLVALHVVVELVGRAVVRPTAALRPHTAVVMPLLCVLITLRCLGVLLLAIAARVPGTRGALGGIPVPSEPPASSCSCSRCCCRS